MKTSAQIVLILCALLFACKDEPITKNCGTLATVRDLTGLDGCWYAFELNDGTRLIPVWDMGYCGTPPLPKEVTEDPLYNFQYTDGKKVSIGYELRPDRVTDCMDGKPAKITCLEEFDLDTEIK
jgi:hypothetical protein